MDLAEAIREQGYQQVEELQSHRYRLAMHENGVSKVTLAYLGDTLAATQFRSESSGPNILRGAFAQFSGLEGMSAFHANDDGNMQTIYKCISLLSRSPRICDLQDELDIKGGYIAYDDEALFTGYEPTNIVRAQLPRQIHMLPEWCEPGCESSTLHTPTLRIPLAGREYVFSAEEAIDPALVKSWAAMALHDTAWLDLPRAAAGIYQFSVANP